MGTHVAAEQARAARERAAAGGGGGCAAPHTHGRALAGCAFACSTDCGWWSWCVSAAPGGCVCAAQQQEAVALGRWLQARAPCGAKSDRRADCRVWRRRHTAVCVRACAGVPRVCVRACALVCVRMREWYHHHSSPWRNAWSVSVHALLWRSPVAGCCPHQHHHRSGAGLGRRLCWARDTRHATRTHTRAGVQHQPPDAQTPRRAVTQP